MEASMDHKMNLFVTEKYAYSLEWANKCMKVMQEPINPDDSTFGGYIKTLNWDGPIRHITNNGGDCCITVSYGEEGAVTMSMMTYADIEDLFPEGEPKYMPNHKWDSKYVEKFLKHNEQDNVNHPAHYKTSSGLEAIDVIDAFTEDLKGYESVYTSQVLKYTLRWKHKNGVEDLEKANWYLTRLINKLKEAQK